MSLTHSHCERFDGEADSYPVAGTATIDFFAEEERIVSDSAAVVIIDCDIPRRSNDCSPGADPIADETRKAGGIRTGEGAADLGVIDGALLAHRNAISHRLQNGTLS
jgi:hypothetical protein